MPAPDPLADTAESFAPSNWKEFVAAVSPSGDAMFSQKSGEASLVGWIDGRRTHGALRFCLGYNNISSGGVIALQRTNPARHPYYPELYCVGAAATPMEPNAQLLKTAAFDDGSGTPSLLYRANYKKARLTLRFAPSPNDIKEDSSVPDRQEWLRNTSIDQEPRTDVLSLSGFQMIYAEGTGLAAPSSSPQGQPYPAEVGQIIIKSDLRVTWDLVPHSLLFLTGTQRPFWLTSLLGFVNLGEFLGYAEGTLLYSGCRLTRHTWPLRRGTEDKYVYTVEMMYSWFDPKKGFSGNPAVQITGNRGHNNFPWRGNFTAGDKNAGRWFYGTFTGGSGDYDLPMFQYAKFQNLFQSANNPQIT